jgi:ATP-binding cassette, subfamily B, bacterial
VLYNGSIEQGDGGRAVHRGGVRIANVVLVAAGRLVGDVPAAARDGLSSPAGDRMIGALAITGLAYAAALLLGPMQSALSSVVKWRLIYNTQDRLIAAVCWACGWRFAAHS